MKALLRSMMKACSTYVRSNTLRLFPYWNSSASETSQSKGSEFRGYGVKGLGRDGKAGLNVALLAFPQGLAYAVIAGLPLVYGLTCSAIAALIAPFFASSRHTILGPTNATALMTASFFLYHPDLPKLAMMPIAVFLVGLFLIFAALFRLADLMQYVSRSVIVGYITGASILIMLNQLAPAMGVPPEVFVLEGGEKVKSLLGKLGKLVMNLNQSHLPSLLIAGISILCFVLLQWRYSKLPGFAITLVLATAVSQFSFFSEVGRFEAVSLSALLPEVGVFSAQAPWHLWQELFPLSFAIAFLATLENSVMAKTLGSRVGENPDMNQDMLSVGAANMACAIGSGMAASGSLTRSALNYSSGAVTRLSSVFSALCCVLGIFLFASWIAHIPKSALAALVICIAWTLFNAKNLRIAFRATKSDAITLVVTLFATMLMPLHTAIFLGVATSIALYLRKASKPFLTEYAFNDTGELMQSEDKKKRDHPAVSIVHVEGELFFGAAELFRTQVQLTCADPNLKVVVLRLKNAHHLDATSVMALEELIVHLRKEDRQVLISGAMKDVYRVLRDSGVLETLGRENLFMGSPSNPNLSTRNALKRAQEILGTSDADIRIFFDPNKK